MEIFSVIVKLQWYFSFRFFSRIDDVLLTLMIFILGTSDEHITTVENLQSLDPDGAVLVTTPQVREYFEQHSLEIN